MNQLKRQTRETILFNNQLIICYENEYSTRMQKKNIREQCIFREAKKKFQRISIWANITLRPVKTKKNERENDENGEYENDK